MIREPSSENILLAGNELQNGNVVAFPTETVYGLGANATNEDAVKKIFAAKKRPSYNPLIIHIADISTIREVATIKPNSIQESRLNKLQSFWPGPLSIVLPKAPSITSSVTAGLDTVAVRIPDHPVALALLKAAAVPIAAPSANSSGYVSPTRAEHVQDLSDSVSMILDGGECRVGIESTVLSLCEDVPTILRPGHVSKEMLEKALQEKVFLKEVDVNEDKAQTSPGQLSAHYQPKTNVITSKGPFSDEHNAAVLLFSEESDKKYPSTFKRKLLSSSYDKHEIAFNLYASLRELDKLELDYIVIDEYSPQLVGEALSDRLKRAVREK